MASVVFFYNKFYNDNNLVVVFSPPIPINVNYSNLKCKGIVILAYLLIIDMWTLFCMVLEHLLSPLFRAIAFTVKVIYITQ